MDALHIREIQLYSYNQLQFLTERESEGDQRVKGGEETKDIYGIFYSDKINLEQGKLKKKNLSVSK